jgi:uncharacterized membrane protein YdjX (TVP38/TMEM64 family)
MHENSRLWLTMIVVLIVIASVITWLFLGAGHAPPAFALGDTDFVTMIRSWENLGIAGSICLMVLHSFIPFPAEALAMANGVLYGPVLGSIITWVGAMLGALTAFGCTRLFGRRFATRLLSVKNWQALESWSMQHGWQTLIVLRLIPVISFNLVNYAIGLTPVRLWTFLWTTGLGIIPVIVVSVLLGDRASTLPLWVWPILILLALVCLAFILWLRQVKLRRDETAGPD